MYAVRNTHCNALVSLILCVVCGAGVRLEHGTGAKVCPAPRIAGPVHGEVLPTASGVPVSERGVCHTGGWWGRGSTCFLCAVHRRLMEKLKAAFGEVMQPRENRQMEDEALVKTMKVCTYVHTYIHSGQSASYYPTCVCIIMALSKLYRKAIRTCTCIHMTCWFISVDSCNIDPNDYSRYCITTHCLCVCVCRGTRVLFQRHLQLLQTQ